MHPVNGEFTGLSAGQHGIRFGEKADYENHTFYLASDYDYVTIGRGIFHVSVDENVSSHVKYSGELTQAVEPGGTVYIYVQPETGYEVSEFTVDNPSYVSGKISYDKEAGFLVIDGVSGNLIVTVKAMEVKAAKEDVANASPVKTEPDPANVPAAVKVATVEASQEAPVEVSGEKQTETVQEEPTDKQQTESEPEQPAVEEPRTQEIENITIEAEEVPKAGKITDVSEENVPGNFPYGWLLLVILAVTSGGIFIKRVSQQKKNNA